LAHIETGFRVSESIMVSVKPFIGKLFSYAYIRKVSGIMLSNAFT
jgi:hypothetical protein